MTGIEALAACAGAALVAGVVLVVVGLRAGPTDRPAPAARSSRGVRRLRAVLAAATIAQSRAQLRRRLATWAVIGLVVWVVTGWPVVGVALFAAGAWLPWLLGSARIAHDRVEQLEALEAWCRRMADTMIGGGAIGLAQAVTVTAPHVDGPIGPAVRLLARRLRDGDALGPAVRELADAIDDRVGDTVAATLLLALHEQTSGAAKVLRQLAEGVARDVRARREVEAARAESRQSIRMLLLIQAGMLVLLALVPGFAAPYRTATGQIVMAALLLGTVGVLVWMRNLAVGRPSPRFLGGGDEPR